MCAALSLLISGLSFETKFKHVEVSAAAVSLPVRRGGGKRRVGSPVPGAVGAAAAVAREPGPVLRVAQLALLLHLEA